MLLDTCVLSELVKPNPDDKVIAFFNQLAHQQVFISSITLAELHRGIARLNPSKRQLELTQWLETLEENYAANILDFERATARVWGQLTALAQKQGKTLSFMDSMIAATAIQHQTSVVTRNIADFQYCNIPLINPWA